MVDLKMLSLYFSATNPTKITTRMKKPKIYQTRQTMQIVINVAVDRIEKQQKRIEKKIKRKRLKKKKLSVSL